MEATTALEPPQQHEAAQMSVPAPKAAHNQTPANAQVTMHTPSEAIQPNQVDPNHSMRQRSGTKWYEYSHNSSCSPTSGA